ncbi:MAG: hypothetical protein ACE5FP_10660 [Gemmatimonadota bacterium]
MRYVRFPLVALAVSFAIPVPAVAQEPEDEPHDFPAPWTNMRWGPLQPRQSVLNRHGLEPYKWRQSVREEEDGTIYYFEIWNPNTSPVRAFFDPTHAVRGRLQFRGGEYSGLTYVRSTGGPEEFVPAEFRMGPRQRVRMRFIVAANENRVPDRGDIFWTVPQGAVAATDEQCDEVCPTELVRLFEQSVNQHLSRFVSDPPAGGSVVPDLDSVLVAAREARAVRRQEGVQTLTREMQEARRLAEQQRIDRLQREAERDAMNVDRPIARGEQGSREEAKSGGFDPLPPPAPAVPAIASDPLNRNVPPAGMLANPDSAVIGDDVEDAGAGMPLSGEPDVPRELKDDLWVRVNPESLEGEIRLEVFKFTDDGNLLRWQAWYGERTGYRDELIVDGTWARSEGDVFIDILSTNEVLDGIIDVATLTIGDAVFRIVGPQLSDRARACLVANDRVACLGG